MTVYKTHNIEECIINHQGKTVVFLNYALKKKIRLKGNLIKDVKSLPVKPWLSITDKNITRWTDEVLLYSHHPSYDKIPECDTMIFVECPIQYSDFEKWSSKAKNVIIFQPPSWEFHDEQVMDRYPTADAYVKIYETLARFKGLPLTNQKELALQASQLNPSKVSVFTEKEWANNTSISDQRLRNCLKSRYKLFYMKMYIYRLLGEPTNALEDIYHELQKEHDYGGYKILRGNNPSCIYAEGKLNNRIPKFTARLRQLVRGGFVLKYDPIYVVQNRPKADFDWNAIIDRQIKHWSDWEKMRDIVERAELI